MILNYKSFLREKKKEIIKLRYYAKAIKRLYPAKK